MYSSSIHIFHNKTLKTILLILGVIIAVFPIILSIFKVGVDCDSAYYLAIAERVSEGNMLYRDVSYGYMPFWPYLMACIKILFKIPYASMTAYSIWLSIHFLFAIGVSFLLYKIALYIKIQKPLAIFAGFLFLIISHWLDGNAVLLEMPSIFFGLTSISLIFKNGIKNSEKKRGWGLIFILIGIISCLSFMIKQYGLGFLGLCLYVIAFLIEDENRKRKRNHLVCYLIGYSVPIIICFFIWKASFFDIVFSDYGNSDGLISELQLNNIFSNLFWHLYRITPLCFISLAYIPFCKSKKMLKVCFFLLGGFLGFGLQFLFSAGHRYHLYLLPFSILLGLLPYQYLKGHVRKLSYLALFATVMFSLYSTYRNKVYKLYIKGNARQEQVEISKIVSEQVDDSHCIWIAHGGLLYIYYLSNVCPPNLPTVGYSFGPLGINEAEALEQIKAADYVIRYSADFPYETFFTDKLKIKVEEYPAIAIRDSSIIIHRLSH